MRAENRTRSLSDWPGAMTVVLAGIFVGAVLQVAAAFSVPAVAGIPIALAALAALTYADRAARGAERAAAPWLTKRTAVVLLVVITLAALVARIYTLMDRPAWDDEMWTLRNIYTDDWGELLRVALDDYWPPLHYVLLNVVARVADTGILWLRIPSVVFGVAAVAVMYPLGLELFRRRGPALVGSALLAGMTTHVLFSQEARVYAMQSLFVVLSALFFYRSWCDRRISLAFLASAVLLTYSHSFSSWYFLAGQWAFIGVAWLLWKDRRAFQMGLASQALVLVAWLPLVAGFVWSRLRRGIVVPTYWATGEAGLPGPADVVEQYQGLAVRSWAGAALFSVLFVLAAVAAWREFRRSPRDVVEPPRAAGVAPAALLFLACWVVVPVAASLAVSVLTAMSTFGAIRYHLTVVPGLCLLAAAGFAALRTRRAQQFAAATIVLLPVAELPRFYRNFSLTREAHDEAAAIIREHGAEDGTIYVGNGYRVFSYYFRGFFPRIGSERWDSLTAAHAHLTDRSTLHSPKWGDTYAYEKQSPRISYYGYFRANPSLPTDDSFERFVELEVSRGGFQGTYWLVLEHRALDELVALLEAAGVPCRSPEIYQVQRLELRRCNPPDPPEAMSRTPSTEPVTLRQKSDENAGSRRASSVRHSG